MYLYLYLSVFIGCNYNLEGMYESFHIATGKGKIITKIFENVSKF